jgi:5,10-methylenetetrahydromethanopterin reductase
VIDLAFGLGVWQGLAFVDLASLGAEAEHLGYSSVWYANHKLYRDMFVGLTVLGTHTQRVKLGTFVAEPYSLHPALVAAAAASLDEACGGRLVLGLGTGGANFKELGLSRARPARAMAESIEVMRRLLHGERLTFEGEVFSLTDAWLHLPPRPHIPIVLASRGDLVLQVAGRLADGVMLSTYATPRGQRHAREMVALGARQAGRRPEDVHQIIRVDISLDDDAAVARGHVRPMIASSLMNSYPNRRFVEQVGLELTPELEAMCGRKNEAEAFASGHLVPDAFVREFAWAGTPEEVADQIAPIVDLGIHDILVMPHPLDRDPRPMVRAFATEVVPRLRALFGSALASDAGATRAG